MYLENGTNGVNGAAGRDSLAASSPSRPGHRRTRTNSAAPATPTNNQQDAGAGAGGVSPPTTPRRKPTAVVEREESVKDGDIDAYIDGQVRKTSAVGSPSSKSGVASPTTAAAAAATPSPPFLSTVDRQRSAMLSGAVHLNMRAEAQIL